MNAGNAIPIIIVLFIIFFIRSFFSNSYFSIKLRQNGLEKNFYKTILKNAGFSAFGKRVFEFLFDLSIFWIVFIFKNGILFFKFKSIILFIGKMILFLLPNSRECFKQITFPGYSFSMIILITSQMTLTYFCELIYGDESLFNTLISTFIFFIIFSYINTAICFVYGLLPVRILFFACIRCILCYITVFIIDYKIVSSLSHK